MNTTNIDLNDGLINGQFGTVHDFGFINHLITKVYLKSDGESAGEKEMLKDSYALNHQVVPIQMALKNSSQTFKRTQFPLTLAWACSVHKV